MTLIAEASNIVTDEISKRAVIHPLPKAGFISEPACIGNPTLFEDNSTIVSGIITSWTWNISDSLNLDSQNLNLTFSSPGNIEVVLSVVSDKGCKDSTLQMVEVYPETVYADFGYNPNPIQALETRVVFLDSSENATSWFWSIDSVFISSEKNPEYEFLRDTGRYSVRLEVENRFGCLADTSRVLVVQPIVSLYIPSAYSPDGDGVNDQFIIRGEGIESMLITIRDRWGNEVAQIDRWNVPISIPWIDSENSSVYSYDGTFIDKNEIRHYLNGTITVLK
ncbi:PKD domain-containing protein [Salibacteraceae bacterium]|nr:PKD domain-containing protein [Salibacteraceae bacterium]